ncbi:MAG TPA: DUF1592 domain-containing protein [Phenylobacterium sp.]|nr:DUF1592 domain-containing protein [Phenylobacterium sp.]
MATAIGAATALLGAFLAHAQPQPPAAPAAATPAASAAADPKLMLASLATAPGRDQFIKTYCLACHNARLKTAGLVLEGQTTAEPGGNPDLWEKIARRVNQGEMPPKLAPRHPDADAAHAFAASLIAELDVTAQKHPYAGPTVIRRLNRTEYGNAVRDLLAVDFPFATELPADGLAAGFDNIGDALSMSPVLLESYLKVGRKVSELAVGEADPTPVTDQFPADKGQSQWIEGAPFGSRGGIVVRKYFPREGDYELRAFLNDDTLTPLEGIRLFRIKAHVTPGMHTFVATFPNEHAEHEGPVPALAGPGGPGLGGPLDVKGSAWRPTIMFLLDGKKLKDFGIGGASAAEASFGTPGGPPTVVRAEISGPYDAGPVVQSASREKIFICRPKTAAEEPRCAERIFTALARRAYRRQVTSEDIKPILAAFQKARANRDFDGAVAAGIRDLLVAPDFLFRLEFDPRDAKAGQMHRVGDYEMASRLSFFLWSSIPDDQLLDAARRGQLHNRAGLERQVRRMLADRKADALVDNFAAQWLGLRDIADAKPDPQAYPDFDPGLRDSYEEETRLFLRAIMRENRSILDVVDGHYTYVNERLARLYGIPGVKGPGFRRVQLADNSPRGGVLGQGGILMATSHTDHTSPVLRGKWILDNLLNQPPPPPPAGVPPLNVAPVNGHKLTTREEVERHRASPVCSSCHSRMDPYGFALENFDVLGRWRSKDDGGPIDAAGQMPNGDKFTGPSGLRKVLMEHSEVFVGASVSRMMTYALGRPLASRDQPTVRQIVRDTKPGGYRFDDIVLGVVDSTPFQMKQTSAGS